MSGKRIRPGRRWRSHPGRRVAFLVVAAIVLALLSYLLLFQRGTCPRDGAGCLLNANQGVVGAYAVALALLGVLTELFGRARETQTLSQQFTVAVQRAVYDACHNLRHLAEAFDEGRLTSFPEYSLRSAMDLLRPPLSTLLGDLPEGRRVLEHIDHIARNDEMLTRFPPGAALTAMATHTEYLVEHCLRLVIDATRDDDVIFRQTWSLGFGASPERSALAPLLTAVVAGEIQVRFRRSAAVASLGPESAGPLTGAPISSVVCWYDDDPGGPATVTWGGRPLALLAVGDLFRQLDDPPLTTAREPPPPPR
jgi:hypothetical protein